VNFDLRQAWQDIGKNTIGGPHGAICLDNYEDCERFSIHKPFGVWVYIQGYPGEDGGCRMVALIPLEEVGLCPVDEEASDAWENNLWELAGFGWPRGNLGIEGNPGRAFAFPAHWDYTPSMRFIKLTQTINLDI